MRQKAAALALFGLVVGCLCTRATLLAVREEGEVVSLAVELAAKEQKARTRSRRFFPLLLRRVGAGPQAWRTLLSTLGTTAALGGIDENATVLCRWWRP